MRHNLGIEDKNYCLRTWASESARLKGPLQLLGEEIRMFGKLVRRRGGERHRT